MGRGRRPREAGVTALPPICELVPHAPPMILVDEMLDYAPGHARCVVRLRPDSLFVENGRVRALVAVEYMAQSVAAYAGMKSRRHGEPPSIGFLLGSRELKLAVDHFRAGDTLVVDVEHVFGDDQLGSFRCTVWRDEEIVAEAMVNVYQTNGGGPLPP
jgi:predicted hotdog family 3-hydroxylacyl-ACP dehydratase